MRARVIHNKKLPMQRQLPMALDSAPLQTMSSAQRKRVIGQLAQMLLLALDANPTEHDDDDER